MKKNGLFKWNDGSFYDGDIKDNLSDFVWSKTQRRPMIIPIIMEV